MWQKNYMVSNSYQDKYRCDLGLISLSVDRDQDGKYFYNIFGASELKSKQLYDTADEAKMAAMESAKHRLGVTIAHLNSIGIESE